MEKEFLTLASSSPERTREIGQAIGIACRSGDVITVSGGLGSGKTTLTQGIALGLGVKDPVTSPSFVLMKHYSGDKVNLTHLDLYRVESEEEVLELDLEEFSRAGDVVVIEWPDRFYPVLPEQRLNLRIDCDESGGRIIKINGIGERGKAMVNQLKISFHRG